jgi:tetratricopeptide (TPR) repeat protein
MAPTALSKNNRLTAPGPLPPGWGLVRCVALATLFVCGGVWAAPHVPESDSTVLETVPAAAATRKLAAVRARVSEHPEDLQSALALAQGYLDIGRADADPRFVSYAEATLSPWLKPEHPDPAVLTLEATALQYLHRFDEALRLLDHALDEQTFNGQAWLTKATILQVQGRFDAARQACRRLIQTSGQLLALTCLTGVNSLTGKLGASYAALRGVFTDDPRLSAAVRVWILDQLADMAQRAGDGAAAEGYFQAALHVNAADGYTKAEYADLLLRQGRAAEVLRLLQGDEQQDNLLLRLAIAATRLRTEQAQRLSDELQARYEAARRDGDMTHLREQARFLLEVRGSAAAALQIAERNWHVQREPADVRIYWAAASAARNTPQLQRLREWIQHTGYEDAVLDGVAESGLHATKMVGR